VAITVKFSARFEGDGKSFFALDGVGEIGFSA